MPTEVPKESGGFYRWLWLLPVAAALGIAAGVGINMALSNYYEGEHRVSYGLGETTPDNMTGIISGIVGIVVAFITANYGTIFAEIGKVLGSLGISHSLSAAEQRDQYDRIKSISPTPPPPAPTP